MKKFSTEQTDDETLVVRIEGVEVVVKATTEGVSVTLFPADRDLDSVGETWATWAELS